MEVNIELAKRLLKEQYFINGDNKIRTQNPIRVEDLAFIMQKYTDEQLKLCGVMFELPSTKEIKDRILHVIENSFEDNETIEKREYTLGFNACFNWLKIKQMKTKHKVNK